MRLVYNSNLRLNGWRFWFHGHFAIVDSACMISLRQNSASSNVRLAALGAETGPGTFQGRGGAARVPVECALLGTVRCLIMTCNDAVNRE